MSHFALPDGPLGKAAAPQATPLAPRPTKGDVPYHPSPAKDNAQSQQPAAPAPTQVVVQTTLPPPPPPQRKYIKGPGFVIEGGDAQGRIPNF